MIPNRVLLRNRTIQLLIAVNCVVGIMSILFLAIVPWTPLNLMIIMSGWTSAGAWGIGVFLGVKVAKAELTVDSMGGIQKITKFIDELEVFLGSDEVLALIDLLGNKTKKEE